MLRSLRVRDFAIISELCLEPGRGLNVFTGETGAGKSILIEALGFLLGTRATTAWLRAGASRLSVEGVFDAFFRTRRVQDEQTFVSFHCFVSSLVGPFTTPLNRFIAFCIPSSNQHSIWLAARSKTFSISAASPGSNFPST